jgi:tetratricopeptide (TPR) repeat protein
MKNKKHNRPHAAPGAAGPAGLQTWHWLYASIAGAVLLFWAYGPAMHGPFIFDDTKQQFALPTAVEPLSAWIGPVRPILMFTYWANVQASREDTFSFHLVNLVIHLATSLLIFFVIRRLLEWSGAREEDRSPFAAFGAFLFLLHPLQTESVAYITGRSESLCGMFSAASYAAFLYRREKAITWSSVALVVGLFGAAVLTKEQGVVLPVLFLLTDLWWNPEGPLRAVRANWKLYAVLAVGAALGFAMVWKLILGVGTGDSAGFGLKAFTWYQYLFTQFRVLFAYIFNFLLPVNLNIDWDFPISRTIFDQGAIVGLIGLLALAALAWRYRKSFPLSGYGYLVFLALLSPTSSILPIKDPIADRRMYLPMLGLILIALDLLIRLKMERKVMGGLAAGLILVAAMATHARAEVWGNPLLLWQDAAAKSPKKMRPHFQLAFAWQEQGRFDMAVAEFQKTADLEPPTADMLIDWGLAYDGLNQPELAIAKFREAIAKEPSAHAYTQIGYVYAKQSRWKEANEAFDTAAKIDPSFAPTFLYKGQVHLANNELAQAIAEFQHALQLDPRLEPARQALVTTQRRLNAR